MRIGLNLLFRLPDSGGGIETYLQRLLSELVRLDTTNEYVLFVSAAARLLSIAKEPNVKVVNCQVNSDGRVGRYWWEQTILPSQVKANKIELLHSMNFVSPLVCSCKTILTIHDLSYREPTVQMSLKRRMGLRFFSTISARTVDVILTVSEFSKRSICSKLNVSEQKVKVVHSGPGWNSDRPVRLDIERCLQTYGIRGRYVTAIAGGHAHKNIPRLLEAFQASCKDRPHSLVLIGQLPSNVSLSEPFVSHEFRDRIKLLGYVPTQDVYPILAGSDLFVFPSLYEGFGFPVLEAQKAGVAVACSNVASIPEVARNSAAYFDPLSIQSIGNTIRDCLGDAPLRANLIELGLENIRRFSWAEAAKAHIELYSELAYS